MSHYRPSCKCNRLLYQMSQICRWVFTLEWPLNQNYWPTAEAVSLSETTMVEAVWVLKARL